MKNQIILFILFFSFITLYGQDLPVVFQAESGTSGSDFRVVDTLGTTAVTINSDMINTLNPGNEKRVITYQINSFYSETYDLYVRLLVGSGNYNNVAKGPYIIKNWR